MEPLVAEWRERYAAGADRLEVHERQSSVDILRTTGSETTVYRLDPRALDLCRAFERPRHVAAVVPGLRYAEGYEPYDDPDFLARAAAVRRATNCTVQVDTTSDEDAYDRLLVLGILVQESGMAVSVACGTRYLAAPGEDATIPANTHLSLATT